MPQHKKIFDGMKGICLDVGCGQAKQKGFVGMDIEKHPSIDIVHDIQKLPWPIPDSICNKILMSHVIEHVEPKYRFNVFDECWRIIRWDGQLLVSCPYAGSYLESAHFAHYPCPNEGAFQFLDPDYYLWHCSGWNKLKPWRIVRCLPIIGGCLEVILEPRKLKNGKMEILPKEPKFNGIVQK